MHCAVWLLAAAFVVCSSGCCGDAAGGGGRAGASTSEVRDLAMLVSQIYADDFAIVGRSFERLPALYGRGARQAAKVEMAVKSRW